MIAEMPKIVLYCLVATTLLGGIMGFCIAWLKAKSRARSVIAGVQKQFEANRSSAESELHATTMSVADLKQSLAQVRKQAAAAGQREEALDVHAQLQAQRIQSLEAQVSSYEDQQIRLQRDFANYKSNKSRELELARNKPDSWSEADQLPVLQKRVDDHELDKHADSAHSPEAAQASSAERTIRSSTSKRGLSTPLSRELDIPSLSESELPDSVDELEFELVDPDADGGEKRG